MQGEKEGDLSSSPNGRPVAYNRPSLSFPRQNRTQIRQLHAIGRADWEDWNWTATCRSPRVLREKRAKGKEKWLKTWWNLKPRPSSKTGSSHGYNTHIPPLSRKPNPTSLHATFPECGVWSEKWVRRSRQNKKPRRKMSLEVGWTTREGRKKTKKERESRPP
jgi:hypothetical protein